MSKNIKLMLAAMSSGLAWIWASDLRAQRNAVLADPEMGKPPSKDGSVLHHLNDVWPRFMEIANGQRGDTRAGEEMVSKFLAWNGIKAGFILGVIASIVFYVFFSSPASAHMAQSGWKYPMACCSQKDCREYAAENVKAGLEGWVLHDGTVVPYDETLRSGDDKFHRCDHTDGRIRKHWQFKVPCLFVPGAQG